MSENQQSYKSGKTVRIRLQPKSILWALSLKCPTCGKTSLLSKRFSLTFNKGCTYCNYTFEREPGYFWSQSMMISYPILGLLMILIGYTAKHFRPEIGAYQLATLIFLSSIPLIFLTNPFFRAIWMLIDLYFNPINDQDKLSQ